MPPHQIDKDCGEELIIFERETESGVLC